MLTILISPLHQCTKGSTYRGKVMTKGSTCRGKVMMKGSVCRDKVTAIDASYTKLSSGHVNPTEELEMEKGGLYIKS